MALEQMLIYVVLPVAGYLLGSVPFALLIGFSNGVDIRKAGSGNVGATNLARVLGRNGKRGKFFFQAFALDAAKGFFPTLAAALLTDHWGVMIPGWAPLVTGTACFLGHLFPVYLKFKGGKGVATSFGVVLGFWPVYSLAGLAAITIFTGVFLVWRYISLASIIAVISFAALVPVIGRMGVLLMPWPELLPLVVTGAALALVIVLKHRANIGRLLAGTEHRAGAKTSQELTTEGTENTENVT